MAIAHKIWVSAFYMLSTRTSYKELGETYLDKQDKKRVTANLVRRLQKLGYEVELKAKAA